MTFDAIAGILALDAFPKDLVLEKLPNLIKNKKLGLRSPIFI